MFVTAWKLFENPCAADMERTKVGFNKGFSKENSSFSKRTEVELSSMAEKIPNDHVDCSRVIL